MRLLKFILVPLALAMFSVSVTESAPPSAAIDDEYPDFTDSIGSKEYWGSGFTGQIYNNITSVKIEGSLTAPEDGEEIKGGAQRWKQQEWRGTISNSTNPRWVVTIDGTVKVRNHTENHHTSIYPYSADSTAKLRFTGDKSPDPSDTHLAEAKDLDFQPEQTDEGDDDSLEFGPEDEWVRNHAEVKFFLKASVNGNIKTERAREMYVNVEAYLEDAPDGTATAYDGATPINNGEFPIK